MGLDCAADIQFGLILFQPLNLACLVLIGYGVYSFLEDQKIKKRKVSNWHKAAMLSFFFFCALDVVVGAIGIWRFCEALPSRMAGFLMPTHSPLSWTGVGSFFIILFYMRLLKIFDGTNYGLSKCTKCVYVTCFILLLFISLLLAAPFSYAYNFGGEESVLPILYLTAISSFLLLLGLNIATLVLFAYKLFRTVKLVQGAVVTTRRKGAKRDRIVGSISKLTVLSALSITVSILTYIVFIGAAEDEERSKEMAKWAPWFVLTSYMHLLDVMTNFICIAFFFERLKPMYARLCGKCDVRCSECMTRCVFGKKEYYGKTKQQPEADEETATGTGNTSAGTGTGTRTSTGATQSTTAVVQSALGAPGSPKSVASQSTDMEMASVELSAGSEAQTLNKVQSVTITQAPSQDGQDPEP